MTSSAAQAAISSSEYSVDVIMSRPPKTSRLLLLFRWLLLIPQYFFALVVYIVAMVLLLLNYIVVLITGRCAFFGFLSGTIRYGTRLTAYTYFMTDKYPPFSIGEEPDYPAQIVIEHPRKVHRWRVFSFVLAIPHILVLYGLLILWMCTTLIAFVAGLITGRYLPGLFGIAIMTLRYQTRVNAYLYLITEGYPPFSFGS
jgi:Domain of unknown function (DUF4389)